MVETIILLAIGGIVGIFGLILILAVLAEWQDCDRKDKDL